jgi:hypothetical protein
VAEFIPLTMKTIVLQPSAKARQAPDFNREAYVDFVAVQIKFLSFLAYIIRIYQDQVGEGHTYTHSYTIVSLLTSYTMSCRWFVFYHQSQA